MPIEKVGEQATLRTADHPVRTNSPEYAKSRQWLMDTVGGTCVLCGGDSDLTHPGTPGPAASLQDHHGGGIYVVPKGSETPVLVGLNLFPIEWSEGWGAAPAVIRQRVAALDVLLTSLGQSPYSGTFGSAANDVMSYVDSVFNANVKLCAPHHVGLEEKNSKDANGHQAVGIHNIPFPIWAYQGYCDWTNWDMWAGTTGTIAVAPTPSGGGTVLHVSRAAKARSPKNVAENARLVRAWHTGKRNIQLPPGHNLVVAAKKGD